MGEDPGIEEGVFMEDAPVGLEQPVPEDFPPDDADVGNDGEEGDDQSFAPSRNAQDRGWGPGFPNCSRDRLVTAIAGGNGIRLPVRQEIAPLVQSLVRDLEAARQRPFRADWSWGFACRAIGGGNTPSNHSWGLAIDLDAPENPQQKGATPPGRNTMPADAAAIAARYGFRWGGTYRSSPDPMHFEFMETPDDARRRSGQGGGGHGPVPYPGPPPLRRGSRGPSVLRVQQALNMDFSSGPGVFGPKTEAAVKEFQRQHALRDDGVVGARTWAALFP